MRGGDDRTTIPTARARVMSVLSVDQSPRTLFSDTPEKRLAVAIMRNAIFEYISIPRDDNNEKKKRALKKRKRMAGYWLFSDADYPWSFRWVLDHIVGVTISEKFIRDFRYKLRTGQIDKWAVSYMGTKAEGSKWLDE